MRISRACAFAAVISLSCIAKASGDPASNRLVVHEWGTFTALQNEQGRPIGGINTDDEPVPQFVHNLDSMLVQSDSELPQSIFAKGWPRSDRDVLVRLETPVIYFHPPTGSGPMKVDLEVSFRGGWLTQFYPKADASAPGLRSEHYDFGRVTDKSVGTLAWHDLAIGGGSMPGPKTEDKVWLAPRNVNAADVTTPAGESERFLFYRGIGHLAAPLQVSRTPDGKTLQIRADWGDWLSNNPNVTFGPLWLIDVRADGASAMRTLDSIVIDSTSKSKVLGEMPAEFIEAQYSIKTLEQIRTALRTALMHEGLFGDEAEALLNTWEVSYFKRPGLRLFFMVPPVWTETVLPLRISQSALIERAMVGRIELVTPRQRELLRRISAGPASKRNWIDAAMSNAANNDPRLFQQLTNGSKSLLELNANVPDDYRAYVNLGRFRNAIVLDEAAQHPTPSLQAFIKNYQLEAFRTADR